MELINYAIESNKNPHGHGPNPCLSMTCGANKRGALRSWYGSERWSTCLCKPRSELRCAECDWHGVITRGLTMTNWQWSMDLAFLEYYLPKKVHHTWQLDRTSTTGGKCSFTSPKCTYFWVTFWGAWVQGSTLAFKTRCSAPLHRYSSACGRCFVCFGVGPCTLTGSKTKHTQHLPQADE